MWLRGGNNGGRGLQKVPPNSTIKPSYKGPDSIKGEYNILLYKIYIYTYIQTCQILCPEGSGVVAYADVR